MVRVHDSDTVQQNEDKMLTTKTREPSEEGESRPASRTSSRRRSSIEDIRERMRNGSKKLMHMMDSKSDSPSDLAGAEDVGPSMMDLDLESFYHSRQRRRTQFAEEITSALLAAGVPLDSAAQEQASPSKLRGMRMTLSPGEEYENYQKVHAMMLEESTVEDDALEEIDEGIEGENGDADDDASDSLALGTTSSGPMSTAGSHGKIHLHQTHNAPTGGEDGRVAATTLPREKASRRMALHTERTIRGKEELHRPSNQMIDPLGRFRLGWDIISILFIFYNAIVLPFKASFATSTVDNSFEVFLDVFFLVDIAVTFNTAVDRDGSIRYDRKLAASRYLRSWFAVDLIAALPYGYIFTEDGNYSSALRKSLKLLRLVRLLRLFRISRILRRIQNAIFIRSTLSSLMKYCLMVIFISHWFSCIFHAIAASNIETSWIRAQGLEEPDADKWDRYIAALYFSVQTLATIGFGDISGMSANERVFSIFAMIIGGGIFAYGITNIVELVSSLTIQETRFRQKMDEVNEYMSARELPVKLRMEIREFYHNTRQSRESKLNSEHQILSDLSSKLRSKIALSINDQFLRKFPFFTGSEPNFLMELALNMRMIHFAPLEDAIIEGEIGHEMFFIFHGAVEVRKKDVRIGILGENQYFGEMAILSPDNRRTATVRTLCFCELRMLSRARFLEALALFPQMQSKMAQIAQGRAAPTHLQPIFEQMGKQQHKAKTGFNPISTSVASVATAAVAAAPATTQSEKRSSGSAGKPPIAPPHSQTVQESPRTTIASISTPPSRTPPVSTPLRNSSARLHLEHGTSASFRGGARATTSARIGSRRNSGNAGQAGVSPGMSIMISDVATLLEEATLRQNQLVKEVLKLKDDMDRIRMPLQNVDTDNGTDEGVSVEM